MSLVSLMLLALSAAAPAHGASACDRYASPAGSDRAPGRHARPFRTPQRLVDALRPGQTGCLLSGVYGKEVDGPFILNVRRGGRRGSPITIRSAPGQRARLRGIIYVWKQSSFVTLSDLDIDARRPRPDGTTGIQINARHTVLERNTITNHGRGICSVLGYPGFGRAVKTVIRNNTFHDCGGTSNQLEHSLYIEWSSGVRVTGNLFLRSGSYAIHFYPEAEGSTVRRNVMVDNGGGVIFAGKGRQASRGNVVEQNVIVGSYRKPGIHSWWSGRVGTGNVARENCLSNPTEDVDRRYGGFSTSGNVIARPVFRNAAAGDFRLRQGSPCRSLILAGAVAAGRRHQDAGGVLDEPLCRLSACVR